MNRSSRPGSSRLGDLFRKPSLAGQQRFLGKVMLAGPASTPIALALSGTCLAAIIALAFIIEVPSRLNAPGVLLPEGGLTAIQSEQGGVIEEVLVKSGATVAAGETLMTLRVDRSLADGSGSYETRVRSITRQLEMLRQRRQRERIAFDRRLESMRLRHAGLKSTLRSLTNRVQNAERQWEIAANDHQRLMELARAGHVAGRDAEPAELRRLQVEATLSQLRSEHLDVQTSIERIGQDMDAEQASFQSLDLDLAMESEGLAGRGVELESLVRRAIVAPMRGQLADVSASPGDMVSAGTVLATLQRPESRMEARLYLSSLVAGRAEPGQAAVLKLPSFPSRQFGVLRGELVAMTSTPMEPRDVRLVPNLLTPVYEARVTLERQYMDSMGRRWPLSSGLGVEATIIESRRSLISWLLEPLIRGAGVPVADARE